MQMGRCGNGDCVDVEIEQLLDISDGRTAKRARDEIGLLEIGIRDADKLRSRQTSEHPGMIAAHYANADHADTQQRLRIRFYRLHHNILTDFPWPRPSAKTSPSTLRAGWRPLRAKTVNTF